MMIQNPFNKKHRVTIQPYDDEDYVFRNSLSEDKTFQNMERNVLGEEPKSWNQCKFSTKEDVTRDFVVNNPKKLKGFEFNAKKARNW